MNTNDIIILFVMAAAAMAAAGSFAAIAKYMFDRGLADQKQPTLNIIEFYKTYLAHTRKATGRIGGVFWIHSISAGIFIATGVGYSIARFLLPHLMGR